MLFLLFSERTFNTLCSSCGLSVLLVLREMQRCGWFSFSMACGLWFPENTMARKWCSISLFHTLLSLNGAARARIWGNSYLHFTFFLAYWHTETWKMVVLMTNILCSTVKFGELIEVSRTHVLKCMEGIGTFALPDWIHKFSHSKGRESVMISFLISTNPLLLVNVAGFYPGRTAHRNFWWMVEYNLGILLPQPEGREISWEHMEKCCWMSWGTLQTLRTQICMQNLLLLLLRDLLEIHSFKRSWNKHFKHH